MSGKSSSTQSPASSGSPDGVYHRSSPKSNAQRGFTPETLEKAHPSLLADLRSTKDTERMVSTPYAAGANTTFTPPPSVSSGYESQAYPPVKYTLSQISTSSPPTATATATATAVQPSMDPWVGNNATATQPTSPHCIVGATGYVPAPSDTHSAFGMLGGDPDWDMQWHSFMDQLGMFTSDPNAPYAAAQLKTER